MDWLFEVGIEKPEKGGRDATRLIEAQLRAAIADGRLAPGIRLPATRQAAAALGVSRNTAVEVYDRLVHNGYVVARQGAGTFVTDRLPTPSVEPDRGALTSSWPLNRFWLEPEVVDAIGFWGARENEPLNNPLTIDMRPALVDARTFPHDVFRRIIAQQLRAIERSPPSYRGPRGNQGNSRLRSAITRHIAVTRAVSCRPEDVIVVAGAQQAFDLLARSLIDRPGVVVAIEDPGYPPMRAAFAAAGAALRFTPVDNEGLQVEALPDAARIVCLCPSHQFPLGVSMSPARRRALLAWASQRGAVIVEDDYDGEFRHAENPLEALRAGSPDIVFYVGTFSKCMLPSLRLGFLVAPRWARPTLVAAKNVLDWHSPILVQAGVAAFISEGHLTRHVRRMREVYRRRRELLLERLASDFRDLLEPIPSSYGMHLSVLARPGVKVEEAADLLGHRGVKVHSLKRYYRGPVARQGLVIGFGVANEEAIEIGLDMLHETLRH